MLDKALSKLISKSKDNPLLQDPNLESFGEKWDDIKNLIIACDMWGNCLLKHDYPILEEEFAKYDPNKMISTSLSLIEDVLLTDHHSRSEY